MLFSSCKQENSNFAFGRMGRIFEFIALEWFFVIRLATVWATSGAK